MRAIGLDIGTTSISAVVAEDGKVIHSVTEQSRAAIKAPFPENRLQSAEIIAEQEPIRMLKVQFRKSLRIILLLSS